MSGGKAIVRQRIEQIQGVHRTWIEWVSEGDPFGRALVVEIDTPTDPEEPGFNPRLIEEISSVAAHALQHETTMVISAVKIVPTQDR